MRRFLFTLLLVSCAPQPVPPPVVPDDPSGYTCQTAAAKLDELGGCGFVPGEFGPLCVDAQEAEARAGVALPVGCFSVAESCEEVERCR